jgi:response regulator NasT
MSLRILVVDRHAERAKQVVRALEGVGHEVTPVIRANVDLYREVQVRAPDVIVVSMDSPSRDTLESIQAITAGQPRPIVMFSNAADEETIHSAIRAGVSAYVVDGLQPHRLKAIMDVAIARFREFQALRQELHQARQSLAERKVIDRAKGILMKTRGLSEDEAYTALRKMAMARNRKLVEIAESVITALDLLGS